VITTSAPEAGAGHPADTAKAEVGGASPVGGPPPGRRLFGTLREIASEIWQYRQLTYQLALRDVRIRYKQAVMGFAWAILMPGLIVLAGALVRYAMAYVSGSDVNGGEIAGMAVKAVPWAFFVGAIGFATTSLTGNAQLVSKVYFPRVAYSLGILMWIPILAALLFAFTLGTALLLGCANLFFRDVKYIVQVLLTFGIFFTPVFFEPAMFGPLGAQVMMLNPLAPLLEGLRLAVVEGHNLLQPLIVVSGRGAEVIAWRPEYLLYAVASAVGALTVGALVFHRFEFVFAEYV
jgi:ABC-type polysaccharide/polyol phosphate export permease